MAKKKHSKQSKGKKKNTPASNKTGTKKAKLILALICAAFGFLLYTNTLQHAYTLDDYSVIKDNFVTKQGVAGIPTLLTTNYRHGYWNSVGTLYRPVSLVMYALEWQVAPDSPFVSHFVNVLFYGLTGFLLFFTLSRFWPEKSILLPFLMTLVFMAHPVHTEIVANIKSRDEMLTFFFSILTLFWLWDYLKSKKVKWLIFSLLSFTLAMFSKENAVTFLAVIPLAIYFFSKKTVKEVIQISALFVIPVVLYLLARQQVLSNSVMAAESVSVLDNFLVGTKDMGTRWSGAFMMLGKYLQVLVLPYLLVHELGYAQIPLEGWGNWKSIVSLLLYGGMGIYGLTQLRNKSLIGFGILFFLMTFSIFMNLFIVIGTSYGERFLYMPSLGYAIVLIAILSSIFKVDKDPRKIDLAALFKSNAKLIAVVGGILLFYSFKTITRNPDWYNSHTLYSADIKKVPNSAKLNFHHGLELGKMGAASKDQNQKRKWIDEAVKHVSRAIEIYPKYGDAHSQLGLLMFRKGQNNKALENYNTAIKYKPTDAKIYSNMGIIYFQKNDFAKAEEVYRKAVELDPRFVDALRNLGSVFAQTGRPDLAISKFKEALKYDPNNPTLHLYLGYAYRDKGDQASSQSWLNKAYQINPALRPK